MPQPFACKLFQGSGLLGGSSWPMVFWTPHGQRTSWEALP